MRMRLLLACCVVSVAFAYDSTGLYGYGQTITFDSSGIATVTCDSAGGFYNVGSVSSATYSSSTGLWTGQIDYSSVLCNLKTGTCTGRETYTGPFATYGGCVAYSNTTGYYYNYCKSDYVTTTYGGSTVKKFVYQICAECGLCIPETTTYSAPKLRSQPSRTQSTSTAFAGAAQLSDSPVKCSQDGITEVAETRRTGWYTKATSPVVNWDFCAKSGESACQDLVFKWVDSRGKACDYYGRGICSSRATLQSSSASDTGLPMSAYASTSALLDASEVCCMCGGGTKKCLASGVPFEFRDYYLYDWTDCGGKVFKETCSVSCVLDSSITSSSTCTRAGGLTDTTTRQAYIDGSQFPTGCPDSSGGWGIYTDPDGATGKNKRCSESGLSTMTADNKMYLDCLKMAEKQCLSYVAWNSTTGLCSLYGQDGCGSLVAENYTYVISGPASRPNLAFAPQLASCVQSGNTVALSFTTYDCLNPDVTNTTFQLKTAWQTAVGSPSGFQTDALTYDPEVTSVSVVLDSTITSGTTVYFTVTVEALPEGTATGPESNSCQLTIAPY